MMRDEVFWTRVNAALDERRDPLADEHVQDALAERPERLDRLLALERRLGALPRAQRHTTRRPWLVAAAAAVLVALGAFAFHAFAPDAEPTDSAPTRGDLGGEVVDFRLEVSRTVGNALTVVRVDSTGTRRFHSIVAPDVVASVSVDSTGAKSP